MSETTSPSPKKEKILIALSDASLANLVSLKLKEQGYGVITASTGGEALEKMRKMNPDLLLIDLILQEKNGYDVLIDKSFDRVITKIPVIIISNTGAPIEMRRIPSTSSVKDYIIKAHVDPMEVLQKVVAVFGHTISEDNHATTTPKVSKKILWAEDDKFLSSILLKKFESSGYTVLKANNGDEALTLIQKEIPDVIVLDILLPGLSGFDILQKIKMQEQYRNIPAMMLSNMSKPSDIEKAKLLGAQKFLVKAAVSLDQIVKEVASLVG